MSPDGDADPAAGDQHPVDLGHGARRGAPHAAEAGHHVEARLPPRKGVHVAHTDVRRGVTVPGHRDESLRGIDSRAPRPAQMRQLEGQSTPARHVEEADTFVEGELVVEGDVLPAVGELAQRGEVNGSSAPSLVYDGPIRAWRSWVVHLGLPPFFRRSTSHIGQGSAEGNYFQQ